MGGANYSQMPPGSFISGQFSEPGGHYLTRAIVLATGIFFFFNFHGIPTFSVLTEWYMLT